MTNCTEGHPVRLTKDITYVSNHELFRVERVLTILH